jgi:hypothetical protein
LRRGARYARKKLRVPIGTFFSSLMPVVVEHMVRANFQRFIFSKRSLPRVRYILRLQRELRT